MLRIKGCVRIEGIRGIESLRISLTYGTKPNWDAHHNNSLELVDFTHNTMNINTINST
jgi:hypothetical protein